MDRKEFIKSIGMLAGSALVLPATIFKKKQVAKEATQILGEPQPIDLGRGFRSGDIVRYLNKDNEYQYALYDGKTIRNIESGEYESISYSKVQRIASTMNIS